MLRRILIVSLILCGLAQAENISIKTDLNEYEISYFHMAGVRMIPHGAIDQTKSSVISKYGAESLISFDRGFQIGSNSFGYVAHTVKEGTALFLISCSKGNINSMTITGVCKKGDWRLEIIKLLELSIKELDRLDSIIN